LPAKEILPDFCCFIFVLFLLLDPVVNPVMAQSLRPEIFFLDEYQKHDS